MSEGELRALLQELLDVVDEKDERGEPTIGGDHTGAVNWLLDFAERVRPALEIKPPQRRGVDFPCEKCGKLEGSKLNDGWYRCSACGYPGK